MRVAAIGLVFLAAGTLPAQIVLKPRGEESAPLRPKTLDLDVTIRKGVAESKFDYVFANEGQWQGEADFLIAIPENGVVTGFAYWYEGEKVIARVAEKERAREIYKAITTRRRDPALIELVGKRTFRVKVFPVEANADLRVELKMVQALPSTSHGPQLAVPLKKLGKLEKIDVDIRGEGPFASNLLGKRVPNLRFHAENATTPDLRVTAVRTKRPFVADLRAARSGGAGGFFALTLTAAKGLQRPKLSFAGVTVKDVMGLPSRMTPGKAYTVVGRYENVRPGAKMFLAGSGGGRYTQSLNFSSAPEPNGPAAKLWAWAKIGRSTNRKEIVALSMRHTVPSRYTSWIAIPTEERKRFAREIAIGDLRRFGHRVAAAVKRYGITSPQAKRQISAYRAKAKSLGLDPREGGVDLFEYTERLAIRWQREVSRRGENSPVAQRILRQLDALAELGNSTGQVQSYYGQQATAMARRVYEDRFEGRADAASRGRRAKLDRYARRVGYRNGDGLLASIGQTETSRLANQIVLAERKGGEPAEADLRALARHEQAARIPVGTVLRNERGNHAYFAASDVGRLIYEELQKDEPDLARLRELHARRTKEIPALRAIGHSLPSALGGYRMKLSGFFEDVAAGKRSPSEAATEREKMKAVAEAIGEPAEPLYEETLSDAMRSSEIFVDSYEKMARRDRVQLAFARERVENLRALNSKGSPYPAESERGEPDQKTRNAYVEARHRGEDRPDLLQRIRAGETWRGAEWPRLRADILETLTELDQMDARPLSPEEERTKAELERRAQELSARIGDPIVTFDAPENAIGLHAVLPEGTRLPMVWVARHRRWEARFDIPAGTPDGPFAVRIEGAYSDGRPISERAEFRVDSSAPKVQVERDGTILVLKTDEDVVRAVALGLDGSRREMVRHSPGRFALRNAPEGDVRVIATDKAHNRSDMAVAEALPKAEAIDPTMNVQALARFGDRLWISTLDAGGRFEGGATVPEVGPWPRQAVATRDALAVRAATGEVHRYDGASWTTIEPNATTLASDGDTLLIGIVGGWIERVGKVRRSVRLPELAGRVVTCLLADGDRLWIGTQGRGLYEWDRKSGTGVWHDERHGLTDDWITALGRDSSGRIVAGTFVGGAVALVEGKWSVVPGTEGTCVTAVLGDLVATRHGLVRDGRIIAAGEAQALAPSSVGLVAGWRGRIEAVGR